MSRVAVEPHMVRWARERAGMAQEELIPRFKKLAEWESGEVLPTFRQLQRFAKAVRVPFGYLFLPHPPKECLSLTDFRTGTTKAGAKASPDLIETVYAMRLRQAWLREHFVEIGADPLDFAASAHLAHDPEAVGRQMRGRLGLEDGWAAGVRTWQDAVNELRRLIEGLGVMAVINGVVGNNTHRPLSVDEFRGFALADRYAPLIFVNGADSKSAQMFTLAHELAHIWLGEKALSGFATLMPGGAPVEDWCNRAAAELLVPSRELLVRWEDVRKQPRRFEELAKSFKVSPVVAARRSLDLKLFDHNAFVEFYEDYTSRERRGGTTPSGGDFYNKQNGRVGALFATHVMEAAMGGEVGFKEAYQLTDLWSGTFEAYAKRLGVRM